MNLFPILRLLGGFFAGGAVGLAVLYLLLPLSLLLDRGHYRGFGAAMLITMAWPFAVVGGALPGAWLANRWKEQRRGLVLVGFGWLCALGAGGAVLEAQRRSAKLPGSRDAERRAAGRQERLDRWASSYGRRYWPERYPRWGLFSSPDLEAPPSRENLEALFGPLLYPASRTVKAGVSDDRRWGPLPELVWEFVFETDDSLPEVIGHYMSVLPEGISYDGGGDMGKEGTLVGDSRRQRSADGRVTWLRVTGKHTDFVIRLWTTQDRRGPENARAWRLPRAWEDLETRRRVTAAAQREALQSLRERDAALTYPRAELAWTDLSGDRRVPPVVYRTSDELVDVLRFYETSLGKPRKRRGWHEFSCAGENCPRVAAVAADRVLVMLGRP